MPRPTVTRCRLTILLCSACGEGIGRGAFRGMLEWVLCQRNELVLQIAVRRDSGCRPGPSGMSYGGVAKDKLWIV